MAGEIIFTYKRKRRLSNSVVNPKNGCPNSAFEYSIDNCLFNEEKHVEICKNISEDHKSESRVSRQDTAPLITFSRRSKKVNNLGEVDLQNNWLAAQNKYFLHKATLHKGCSVAQATAMELPLKDSILHRLSCMNHDNIKEGADFPTTQPKTALENTNKISVGKEPINEGTISPGLSPVEDIHGAVASNCLGVSSNDSNKDFSMDGPSLSTPLLLPGNQASIGGESQSMIFDDTTTMPSESPRASNISLPLPDSCATTMDCDIVSDSRSLKQPNLNLSTFGNTITSGCSNDSSALVDEFPKFRPLNGSAGNTRSSNLHQQLHASTHNSTKDLNKNYKDHANACSIDFRKKCLQLFSDVKDNNKSNPPVRKDDEITDLHLGREGNNGFIPSSKPKFGFKNSILTSDFLSPLTESLERFYDSSWSEEELDFLWIGVRRYGRDKWDAILKDPKFHFCSWRAAADLARRWEHEQLKLVLKSPETKLSLGDVYARKKGRPVYGTKIGRLSPCRFRWEKYHTGFDGAKGKDLPHWMKDAVGNPRVHKR